MIQYKLFKVVKKEKQEFELEDWGYEFESLVEGFEFLESFLKDKPEEMRDFTILPSNYKDLPLKVEGK